MNVKNVNDGVCAETDAVTDGFVGVARGDARCRKLASLAGIPEPTASNMKAWLSTTGEIEDSPAQRFNAANVGFPGRYVMIKGKADTILVADGWSGLIDGTLDTTADKGIVFTQFGVAIAMGAVWTNTASDGKSSSDENHCDGWADADAENPGGWYGDASFKDVKWTAKGMSDCGFPARLYCFEDPLLPDRRG